MSIDHTPLPFSQGNQISAMNQIGLCTILFCYYTETNLSVEDIYSFLACYFLRPLTTPYFFNPINILFVLSLTLMAHLSFFIFFYFLLMVIK